MPHRPRRLLPLLALPACLLWSAAALAVDRTQTLSGHGLALDGLCARSVTISVDPALRDRVVATASAAHAEEIDRLSFESTDQARIRPLPDVHGCWHPPGSVSFEPTLTMILHVPTRFPLEVAESGAATYRIGAIGSFSLALSGSGDVSVAAVSGETSASLSGSARVAIDAVDADSAQFSVSGSGTIGIAHGRIDSAAIHVSGDGGVRIGADVKDAAVMLSGSGNVRLARVTGDLTRMVSGSGSLSVNGR